MTALQIRHVRESEIPKLLQLIRAKAEFDGCPDALVATVESLRDALFAGKPLAHALVAEVDGGLVGMATYYATFSSFIARPGLWLDDLFVYPEFRNRRIGEALMRELSAIAKEAGSGRIDWHVSHLNERGMNFYRRIGANISERIRLVRLTEEGIESLAEYKP